MLRRAGAKYRHGPSRFAGLITNSAVLGESHISEPYLPWRLDLTQTRIISGLGESMCGLSCKSKRVRQAN